MARAVDHLHAGLPRDPRGGYGVALPGRPGASIHEGPHVHLSRCREVHARPALLPRRAAADARRVAARPRRLPPDHAPGPPLDRLAVTSGAVMAVEVPPDER